MSRQIPPISAHLVQRADRSRVIIARVRRPRRRVSAVCGFGKALGKLEELLRAMMVRWRSIIQRKNSIGYSRTKKSFRNKPLIIVISDLHIGAGPLDDFDVDIELQFVEFLHHLSKRSRPIELVINGDFLDFVQSDPWKSKELRASSANDRLLFFTEQQSLMKLDSILLYHPDVFTALGRFLSENSDHQICILPGNHDPDIFWQGVRARLRTVIEPQATAPVVDD
jgi:hypothetical protein